MNAPAIVDRARERSLARIADFEVMVLHPHRPTREFWRAMLKARVEFLDDDCLNYGLLDYERDELAALTRLLLVNGLGMPVEEEEEEEPKPFGGNGVLWFVGALALVPWLVLLWTWIAQ